MTRCSYSKYEMRFMQQIWDEVYAGNFTWNLDYSVNWPILFLYAGLSVRLSDLLSAYLSSCLSVLTHLSRYRSVYFSVLTHLSRYRSVSICLSVCLFSITIHMGAESKTHSKFHPGHVNIAHISFNFFIKQQFSLLVKFQCSDEHLARAN